MVQLRAATGMIFVLMLTATGAWSPGSGNLAYANSPAITTHVCGTLRRNTLWTQASSPYAMDCAIHVPSGVTLTIQPGVHVLASSNAQLQVRGGLVANGTESLPIIFRCAPGCRQWSGIQYRPGADLASTMAYAIVTDARVALLNPPFTVAHMSFHRDRNGVVFRKPTFPSGFAPSGIETSDFDHISRNAIKLGSLGSGPFTITNVAVTHSGTGVQMQGMSASVQHSVFAGNVVGLRILGVGSSTVNVTGNSVVGNRDGVDVEAAPGIHISDNNIYGSRRYNVRATGDLHIDIDAVNNYWGDLVGPEIGNAMDACFLQIAQTLPCVIFKPFLLAPSSDAPVAYGPG